MDMLQDALEAVHSGFLLVELPLTGGRLNALDENDLAITVVLIVNGYDRESRLRVASFVTLALVHVLRTCALSPRR